MIVCEGEKTEPNYFKWYQAELHKLKSLSGIRIPVAGEVQVDVARLGDEIKIAGTGRNTASLIEYTLKLVKKSSMYYTDIWCVFDRDSFPAENYNEAVYLARQNNFKVAYSNEAFELWYLLHYDYHNAAISRTQYKSKLTKQLGKPYRKNSVTMYEDLQTTGGDQQQAIERAKQLLTSYGARSNYANHNPSTTVHLLVEALNQFLEEFEERVKKFP